MYARGRLLAEAHASFSAGMPDAISSAHLPHIVGLMARLQSLQQEGEQQAKAAVARAREALAAASPTRASLTAAQEAVKKARFILTSLGMLLEVEELAPLAEQLRSLESARKLLQRARPRNLSYPDQKISLQGRGEHVNQEPSLDGQELSHPCFDAARPFSFHVSPALPAGLGVDAATGVISGSVQDGGAFAGVFRVVCASALGMIHCNIAISLAPASPPPETALSANVRDKLEAAERRVEALRQRHQRRTEAAAKWSRVQLLTRKADSEEAKLDFAHVARDKAAVKGRVKELRARVKSAQDMQEKLDGLV